MCSGKGDWALPQPGFPIRTSPDHSSVDSSPRLFAASYVLHRLLMPRHPPCALNNLPQKHLLLMTKIIKDARVHYAVLNIRAVPPLVRRLPVTTGGSASRWPGLVFRPGPRKRSRSLRTQQRVWLFFASSPAFHSGKPVVLAVNGALSSPCQCSTLELSLIEQLSMTGSQRLSVPRCSLERR